MTKTEGWIGRHKKLCIFMCFIVVLAAAAGGISVRMKAAKEKMMEAMNQPQTVEVERRSLVSSISATGTIVSAESRGLSAGLTNVKIKSLPVKVGDTVEAGALLCKFDSGDIEENLANARTALSASSEKTQLDLSTAQRSLAETQAASAVEQQRLDQDVADAWHKYLLAVTDLEEAEKEWQEAKRTAGEKEAEFEHRSKKRQEAEASGVSGNDLAALREDEEVWRGKVSSADQAESSAEAAYKQAKTTAENMLDAHEKQVRSREDAFRNSAASIAAKTDSLNSAQLNASTSTLSDQQKVEQYEEQLKDSVLTSPITGVITAISAKEGDTYSGGTLFTIEDVSAYEVSAEIDEYDIGKVEEGQEVVIRTNGTGEEELTGRVKTIAPRATSTASKSTSEVTYNVRISIDEPSDMLKLDMTAKLSIIMESKKNALTVPYEAVREEEKGKFYIEVLEVVQEDAAVEEQSGEDAAGEKQKNAAGVNSPSLSENDTEGGSRTELRKVYVQRGIESDYYIEVIGREVSEGMQVVIPGAKDDGGDLQSIMIEQGPMGGF